MEMSVFRLAVKSLYDYQKNRIALSGRLHEKADGSQMDGEVPSMSKEDIEIFTRFRDTSQEMENEMEKYIAKLLEDVPIWTEWLKGVKGVGVKMAAVIVSEYDINIATTVSKMWAFTGLVPGMKLEKGTKAPYNKWLKSKMVGVLADSFLRCGSEYREFYDAYKHRKESADWGAPKGKGTKEGHRHRAARRYMIKMFLKDLYVQWRTIEGLPVREPYAEEYLEKRHSA